MSVCELSTAPGADIGAAHSYASKSARSHVLEQREVGWQALIATDTVLAICTFGGEKT